MSFSTQAQVTSGIQSSADVLYTPINQQTTYTPYNLPAAYANWGINGSAGYQIVELDNYYAIIEWTSPGDAVIYYAYTTDSGKQYTRSLSVHVVECAPVVGATREQPFDWGNLGSCPATRSSAINTAQDCYLDDFVSTSSTPNAQPSPDAYYRFQLTASSQVNINTCGSSFDTYLHLLNRTTQQVVALDNNGAGCGNGASALGLTLPAGDYLLVAEGAGTASGALNVSLTATPTTQPTLSLVVNQQTVTSGAQLYTTAGTPVSLGASGMDSYAWTQSGTTGAFATGTSVTVAPTQTTTYTLTGTGCGGVYTQTRTVTVHVTQGGNYNYITTRTPQRPGLLTDAAVEAVRPAAELTVGTVYFDGLGRAAQKVDASASPNQKNVVIPTTYDALGRPATQYLPYASTLSGAGPNGWFDTNTLNNQTAFYGSSTTGDKVSNDTQPFARTEYENSPLNRVLRQGAAGADWQPDGNPAATSTDHTVKLQPRTNQAREVRLWECGTSARSVTSPGYYGVGQLVVTETRDENGHLTIEYKDKTGRVVMKKVQEAASVTSTTDAGFLVTQYVYDDLGRLRLVIQPEGTRHLPEPAPTGRLTRELWTGVGGTSVQDVPVYTRPTLSTLSSFEAPVDQADNYGQRVRGYITAPQTGSYTFWLAADDNAELWLSSSEDPGQKVRIANIDVWTPWRTWNWYPSQQSTPVTLQAGQRYYIEALHKEGGGGDNLTVKWQLPSGAQEEPIPGNRLSTDVLWLESGFIDSWCFRYEYDGRGRVIEKQIPGAGAVELVYNARNQVILQRGHAPLQPGEWFFSKYDEIGRVVMTGVLPLGQNGAVMTRQQVQAEAEASTLTGWEKPAPSTALGYTLTNSYPAAVTYPGTASLTADYVNTVTFYDEYEFQAFSGRAFAAEAGVGPANRSEITYGLVTGMMERVIGDANKPWLTTANYYDEQHRLVQTRRDLYPGGWERTTMTLDFAGQVRRSLLRHNFPSHSAAPDHTLRQTFYYDHAGRLTELRQQVDSQDSLIVARQVYNELGQLVDKKLHSSDWGANFLQSVDYRYNIRGWLSNINDRNLSNNGSAFNDADPNEDAPTEQPDLFGMELMYHKNQNLALSTPQYNGNISEVMWRTANTATGRTLRGYAYHYDPANRISGADYRTYEWSWGIYNNQDYSVSGISYDANGNLLSMSRKGLVSAPGATPAYGVLDQLSYKYSATAGVATEGNRLLGVDDPQSTAATHDFEDLTGTYTAGTSQAEYSYDAVGNLTADRNKEISSISYNSLNLPQNLNLTNSRSISYLYTGSGAKVGKIVSSGGFRSTSTTTTYYAGAFVYQAEAIPGGLNAGPELKFAHMPEGRLIYTNNTANRPLRDWKYEYHLKDHLGNLRFAFRDEGDNTQQFSASMEPANATKEEQQFEHVSETRLRDAARARTGNYVARLSATEGRRMGPSITRPVQAGDSIRADVYGRYDHGAPAGRLLRRGALLTGASLATSAGALAGEKTAPVAGTRRWLPYLGGSIALVPQLLKRKPEELPKAFLRYELFNKDSQLVATRIQPLQRTSDDEWQHLHTGLKADSAGYVRVFVVNESGTPAYFDDLGLRLVDSKVQENHYDPWGLNLVGIEDEGEPDYKFQYNSKEKQEEFGLNWADYGARMYDPQLGRWHVADPLAEFYLAHTPFSYVGSNPVLRSDPTGMDWYTDKNGNYVFNKDLNEKNADDFFKNREIEGNYFGKAGTYEVYGINEEGSRTRTISKHRLNEDGSVTNMMSGITLEDGSTVETGLKSIQSADNLPSTFGFKNDEVTETFYNKYQLIDNEWVRLSGIMVPPSQITGFTAPGAVSFPRESWIDANIIKHINDKNVEGALDKRGQAIGILSTWLTQGKFALPDLQTISVTLFFNFMTSNYDRQQGNKEHDAQVDKQRNQQGGYE